MNNCICFLRQSIGFFVFALRHATSCCNPGQSDFRCQIWPATVGNCATFWFAAYSIWAWPGLGSSSWLHWGRAWKLFGCTRKAAGWVFLCRRDSGAGQPGHVQVQVQGLGFRTTIAVSDYVTSALFFGCVFISLNNAIEERLEAAYQHQTARGSCSQLAS